MMTKRPDSGERWIYSFSLDERVPGEHLLRKIKGAIDFDFIYDLVKDHYSHTGAPSIDPLVVFKLSLIGYLYDIKSERKLLEETSVNMAYMWFLGYDIDEPLPDHSIMTKTRNRFGPEAYRRFFEKVVTACVDAGLTEGDTAFLDATIIDSRSGDLGIRSRALVEQLKSSTEGYVKALDWETGGEDEKDSDPSGPPASSHKPKVNERLVSPSDPDAQLVRHKNQKARLAYKGHVAVDGGPARIVTACDLTGGAFAEEHLMWSLLSKHEIVTGTRLKGVSADRRYSTADNYRFLQARSILPAIPMRKGGMSPRGGYGRERFTFDEGTDTFTCPAGKSLHPAKSIGHWKTYRSRKFDCNRCLKKDRCLVGDAERRTLMVSGNLPVYIWAKSRLKTPWARELLRRRRVWPETIFANAKEFHGLSKARHRGRWKTEIQLLMTMSAMNLKKLVKYSGNKAEAAIAEATGAAAARLWRSLFPGPKGRLATGPLSNTSPIP